MTSTYVYPPEIVQSNSPSTGIQNYGQYISISIYKPTATEIQEDLLVSSFQAASPFLAAWAVNKLASGSLASISNLLSSIGTAELVAKTVSFSNIPDSVKSILNSGLGDISAPDIDKLIGSSDSDIGAVGNLLKTAKDARISDSRARLGLGILYEKAQVQIVLPMPKQIKTNYGFEYSEEDFTAINLLNAIKNVGMDISALLSGNLTRSKFNDLLNKSAASPSAKAGLASFLTTVPSGFVDKSFDILGMNPNLTSYIQASTNRAKIPYLEKIFKNVKRRSFELDYTFIPKSQKEVTIIHDIIKQLKIHAHPQKTNNDYYYITPSEFVVNFEFMGKQNSFLPMYGRLAIEDINVDYGSSDGFSAFRPFVGEGDKMLLSPSEIKMSIRFVELELLTQGRIEEGY